MRTFPLFAFDRKVLLLSALAHLTSLTLALPQSQGAPSYTLSSSTSTTSSSTHLSPSLIHSSLPTPTADNDLTERNDQGADVTTETVFSTIVIPTATELTTILTVVTNVPHDTPPSAFTATASTSTSKLAAPNPHCIVEGGEDGICVTVVPIWPTDTLAQAVKRQVNSETRSVSYYSTALVTSLVVVNLTTTKVLTAIHAPNTTYTLTGPLTTSSAPLSPTTTAPVASTSTTTTTVSCASPSWLIDGRCVYNTPGWNPAPHVPTDPPRVARAVQTHLPKILGKERGLRVEFREKEQVKRGEEEKEEEVEGGRKRRQDTGRDMEGEKDGGIKSSGKPVGTKKWMKVVYALEHHALSYCIYHEK